MTWKANDCLPLDKTAADHSPPRLSANADFDSVIYADNGGGRPRGRIFTGMNDERLLILRLRWACIL